MEYLQERKIKINRVTEHKNLYSWCLNEFDEKNTSIQKKDLIPFNWRFWFTGTSLQLSNKLTVIRDGKTDTSDASKSKSIYCNFYSGICLDGENLIRDVSFSIFGTARRIYEFNVTIDELRDSTAEEVCWFNAFPSYVSEGDDFQKEIEPDYAGFSIQLKSEKFNELVKLIENRAIDSVRLSVSKIDGVYAEWTPTITTQYAKILTANNIVDDVNLQDFEGTTVGKVGEFDISFSTHSKLNIKQDSRPMDFNAKFFNDEDEPEKSFFNTPKIIPNNNDANLFQIIKLFNSLKIAVWLIFAALLLILLK